MHLLAGGSLPLPFFFSQPDGRTHDYRSWSVLSGRHAPCLLGDAAMKYFLFLMLLFTHASWAEDYFWERNDGQVVANPVADCQSYSNYYAHAVDGETAVRCFRSGYALIASYIRKGDGCTGGTYNPDTFACEGGISCPDAKPIASTLNLSNGCHNGCAYTNLGGSRDYDNLLSEMTYEYVATGAECIVGDQEITSAEAYNEVNEAGLDCRTSNSIQFCVNADQTCKLINGVEACIDNQTREDLFNCGTFNGQVVCFEKTTSSHCDYVDGERLCIYPDGVKIDTASVDHPDNGGNANRNDKDDILDQADLDQNTPQAQNVKSIVNDTHIRQQAEKQADTDNPKSAVSGIECDKALNCTGDAVQCAIARYEKQQSCLMEYKQSDLQQLVDTNPNSKPLGTYESDTTVIDLEGLISEEGRFVEASTCPESLSFTVFGKAFFITFDPMCDLAGYIRYFILFATWFSVAVLIAKSF